MAAPGRWRYSRYDGSAEDQELSAEELLDALGDDLLYHGDPMAALRRLFQEGFTGRDGQRHEGLSELLERVERRRAELAAQRNDESERIAEELAAILAEEHQAIDAARESATPPGNAGPSAEELAERETRLALLPDSLAGQIGALMEYPFTSPAAAERFEQLLDELREKAASMQLGELGQLAASPESREQLREMLAALNEMLESRAAGQDTSESFSRFMERFGDHFPGDPQSLEELLEGIGQQMAAASSLLASMTPEQRAELGSLTEELLGDLDLAWQLDRLGTNLRDAMRGLDWDRPAGVPPSDPLSLLGEEPASRLAELSRLEALMRGATEPGQLAEIDLAEAERLLGADAARSLEALASFTRRLEAAGLVGREGNRLTLTPEALRRLGTKALDEIFTKLGRDRFGDHARATAGLGHDRDLDSRPYEFGDPFHLEINKTLRNAMARHAAEPAVPGRAAPFELPLRLEAQDFEVERTEQLTTASTVLAIDLSLSMEIEENFLAAKKVAIALQSLIASRFPRDYLALVGFSATAREIAPRELPEVAWDFAYGTNLHHALTLSRQLLAGRSGSKQVIVITDGEPTAHITEGGGVFFDYPPARETIEATLREVARCTKARIVINTFVLGDHGPIRAFVDKMTRLNRGRAFYTTPDSLGDYLLVDFVEQRTSGRRRSLRRGD